MVSMGNVWDRTAEFLSDNLGTLLLALIAIFVPATISANLSELQRGATPATAMLLGIGTFLLALVTFWGQLAITALAIDPALGRQAGKVATRRFPAALLVMIVILLALILLAIPIGVIMAAAGIDFTRLEPGAMPEMPAAAMLWSTLYGLALIPVLLWLSARLSVLLPAVVGDRLALGAIPRAWVLTRGVALRIVGVILLYAIVAIVANLAATTAVGAIMFLIAGRGEDGLSRFTVLGTAFAAKLYVALLARSEAAAAR